MRISESASWGRNFINIFRRSFSNRGVIICEKSRLPSSAYGMISTRTDLSVYPSAWGWESGKHTKVSNASFCLAGLEMISMLLISSCAFQVSLKDRTTFSVGQGWLIPGLFAPVAELSDGHE